MNNKQRKTIFVAIGIMILMLIFPPWQYTIETSSLNKNAMGSYRLIFLGPPDIPVTSKSRYGSKFKKYDISLWKVEVDWTRLILSSAVVILIASGFILYFKDEKSH